MLFHEFLGHLTIDQLSVIKGQHSAFREDGSQLMEIYALKLAQEYRVRDVANLLADRLYADYRSYATPKIIPQRWNMTHYTGGLVVALKNFASEMMALKDSGEIFNIHNLDQQGKMLSRAMERCFNKSCYDMDEVAQWAHHIPEYLSVIFGKDWETSLIDLHNDPNAVDVFDVAQYLRNCGITPVQNSPKDLLKDVILTAFTLYNIGTQGKILVLTLLGRNVLFRSQKSLFRARFLISWIFQAALFELFKFIENESSKTKVKLEIQLVFLKSLIYPKEYCIKFMQCMKGWVFLSAVLCGIRYASTYYVLPNCKKRLNQIKYYSKVAWNKITGKSSDQNEVFITDANGQTTELAVDNPQTLETVESSNQNATGSEQAKSTIQPQDVTNSTNSSVNPVWIHLWNFAFPAVYLYLLYKGEKIPEIRKSVLGVMWASVVAMAELTGRLEKSF